MKNIAQKLSQSHFAIFTIISLAGTVAVVIWFNAIITNNILLSPDSSAATGSGTAGTANGQTAQLPNFDQSTADRIRQLRPSSEVNVAPPLDIPGRSNPFAE